MKLFGNKKDKLKQIAKLFIPPIVLQWSKIIFNRFYTFDGCYTDFNKVPLRRIGIYDSAELLRERYLDAGKILNEIECKNRLFEGCVNGTTAKLLPLIVSVLYKEYAHNIKVLDFGGGFGIGYFDCVKMLNKSSKYEFHIVETNQLSGKGKKLFREYDNILFYDSLPDRSLQFDIINIGSVLQYIENYKDKIAELCSLNARFFLMTNHYMGNSDTYATRQINMPKSDSAYWILGYDEIVNIMDSNGYRLIYKSTDYQGHKFKNVPKDKIVESSCNLLFTLKK